MTANKKGYRLDTTRQMQAGVFIMVLNKVVSLYLKNLWVLMFLIWLWSNEIFLQVLKRGQNFLKAIPNTSGSNLLSWFLRPVFEHRLVQSFFGLLIIGTLFLSGLMDSLVAAEFISQPTKLSGENELSFVETPKEVKITTEKRFQMPVELIGISQGFNSHHPGIDLRAAINSDIFPVTGGVVKEVVRSTWGYGQAILIDHQDGYASMYAHVGQIYVDPGLNVDKNTVIATIGMTGYTTGPHLHLETYKNNRAINPKLLIED